MADPDEVRKVIAKLNDGVPFVRACSHYRITPQQFWARVLNNRDLKREVAVTCISTAWNRADEASVEPGNTAALNTFVKLARDMAASLSPQDWGEKVQIEQTKLVINTNLDFGAVTGFDAAVRDAKVIEHEEDDD